MAYDEKYRKRAVEYRKEGNTLEETANIFKVSISTLRGWIKKYEETGEIKNKPLNRPHKKIDPIALEAYVEKYPDAYLEEIAAVFGCGESAIRKALKRQQITRKKRHHATKSNIPSK